MAFLSFFIFFSKSKFLKFELFFSFHIFFQLKTQPARTNLLFAIEKFEFPMHIHAHARI